MDAVDLLVTLPDGANKGQKKFEHFQIRARKLEQKTFVLHTKATEDSHQGYHIPPCVNECSLSFEKLVHSSRPAAWRQMEIHLTNTAIAISEIFEAVPAQECVCFQHQLMGSHRRVVMAPFKDSLSTSSCNTKPLSRDGKKGETSLETTNAQHHIFELFWELPSILSLGVTSQSSVMRVFSWLRHLATAHVCNKIL